jgi:mannose-1-phosphate guanylyltransferase
MSQTFLRNGRWLTLEQIKEMNKPVVVNKSTKEEVQDNTSEVITEEPKEEVIVKPRARKSNKK